MILGVRLAGRERERGLRLREVEGGRGGGGGCRPLPPTKHPPLLVLLFLFNKASQLSGGEGCLPPPFPRVCVCVCFFFP